MTLSNHTKTLVPKNVLFIIYKITAVRENRPSSRQIHRAPTAAYRWKLVYEWALFLFRCCFEISLFVFISDHHLSCFSNLNRINSNRFRLVVCLLDRTVSRLSSAAMESPTFSQELYFLIFKYLEGSNCQNAANALREEIARHNLLPGRITWQGDEREQDLATFESRHTHISNDFLLKIVARVGSLLDQQIPSSTRSVNTLLGSGSQSLLRTSSGKLDWPVGQCAFLVDCRSLRADRNRSTETAISSGCSCGCSCCRFVYIGVPCVRTRSVRKCAD